MPTVAQGSGRTCVDSCRWSGGRGGVVGKKGSNTRGAPAKFRLDLHATTQVFTSARDAKIHHTVRPEWDIPTSAEEYKQYVSMSLWIACHIRPVHSLLCAADLLDFRRAPKLKNLKCVFLCSPKTQPSSYNCFI